MKSELLLPVGNMAMCLAAIHHGADAVYFGVPFFNARGRTADLTFEEIKEMIELCHLYGVKTNLAFNVVIFQNEIPKVVEILRQLIPLSPDALIVQDLGLAKIIRQMAPNQRIHASTQMTVTNSDAIQFLQDLKIDRFVLGRENSILEMRLIREKTAKELEVFVHGALCVAYSGQCFTSESIGGRSANRGQCAQSCRLEYELYVDNHKRDTGEKKYLVSPKDLMGIEHILELEELGINSFKVEGRLKTPEYVASAARNYREVLDGGAMNLEVRSLELASTYSRGFFTGWLKGVDHQHLVDGSYSAHRGIIIGTVKEKHSKFFILNSKYDLHPGMGLLFVSSNLEFGSKIFKVNKGQKGYEIELLDKSLDIIPGMKVYLNSNDRLEKNLQKRWQSREFQKRIPLKMLLTGQIGSVLTLEVFDPEGRRVEINSQAVLEKAQKFSSTIKEIKDELAALGGSVYKLLEFEAKLPLDCFINNRDLKQLRKNAVEKMNELRITPASNIVQSFELPSSPRISVQTKLNVLLRSKQQVEGLVSAYKKGEFEPHSQLLGDIILDYEFGKDYSVSVDLIRSTGLRVAIATTRILKPQEYHNLKMISRLMPDKILARNLGAVEFLKSESQIELLGDFSLNVTNSLAAHYLLDKGLSSVTASYDLNQDQLFDLVQHMDASKLEVTLHQYMPEFHMEHCVFAAFLSNGSSFRDCGKPCEKHEVKLKDPYGHWHFLKADHECRNTFYKASPQSASFMVKDLKKLGVGRLRIEALNEDSKVFNHKISIYLKVLAGTIDSKQAMGMLELFEGYGIGVGQMAKIDHYQDRKKF